MKWQKKYELYIQFIKPEYLAGLSVSDCLEKFDISYPTLLQYLKEDGLTRDAFETLCVKYKTTSQEVISYYLAGNSLKDCAKKFGIHEVTLSLNFKKKGIPVRTLAEANKLSGKDRKGQPAWNKGSWKDKVSEDELVSYYQEGHTLKECREKFKIDTISIRDAMEQHGILRTKSTARLLSLKEHPEYQEKLVESLKKSARSGPDNHFFGKPGYWAGKHIPKEVSDKGKQTRLERFGAYFSDESIESIRKNLIGVSAGEKNWNFGKSPVSSFKRFIYKDIKLDSSYEYEFVKYLDSKNIPWTRNYKRINLEDEQGKFTYVPDFIVNGEIVETKGWFSPRAVRVMKALLKAEIKVKYFDVVELKKLGLPIAGSNGKSFGIRDWYPYFGFNC